MFHQMSVRGPRLASGTRACSLPHKLTHLHAFGSWTHTGRCWHWVLPTALQGPVPSATPPSPFIRGSLPSTYFRLESSRTRPCTVSVASSILAASQALTPATRVLGGKGGMTRGLTLDGSAKSVLGAFAGPGAVSSLEVHPFDRHEAATGRALMASPLAVPWKAHQVWPPPHHLSPCLDSCHSLPGPQFLPLQPVPHAVLGWGGL